ncbi:MAG: CRISPR-associated protein Cas6/Csy4, subtype I-F/YPEST [Osedax symbiont Rs1]|nr:MAG: CRISPR-associated protein Cas6/Csy4, subtype I-F/YPEST [Osedax symbiont Rs1]
MDSYIDIRINPDAEMRQNILLNKIFTKFHKVLCDLSANDIGVSFPEAKVLLGRLIRIHATASRLQELMATKWLGGLVGYCDCSDIKSIPNNTLHRRISRWQHNMSGSHLRRLIKRGSIADDEIKAYKAKMFAVQMTELPFLELESNTNGNHHRRYFQMTESQQEAIKGEFDYFGLSKTATIAWF